MTEHNFRKMSFVQFLLLIVLVQSIIITEIQAKVYSRCELARTLHRTYKFPKHQLSDWVCLIEAESSRNTALVGRPNKDGSQDYGLFQIDSIYWCFGGPKSRHNVCHISCHALTDDNISDDVKCAKHIFHQQGFSAWYGWRNKCKGRNLRRYTSDCKL